MDWSDGNGVSEAFETITLKQGAIVIVDAAHGI
jgi:hypothetical protein